MRGLLIAALAVAVVASLGGQQVLSDREPDGVTSAQKDGKSLLDRLGD
ncbi:hypothetical protein [Micromonospora sp. URMC 103]